MVRCPTAAARVGLIRPFPFVVLTLAQPIVAWLGFSVRPFPLMGTSHPQPDAFAPLGATRSGERSGNKDTPPPSTFIPRHRFRPVMPFIVVRNDRNPTRIPVTNLVHIAVTIPYSRARSRVESPSRRGARSHAGRYLSRVKTAHPWGDSTPDKA